MHKIDATENRRLLEKAEAIDKRLVDRKISAYISTLYSALEQIKNFGRPKYRFYVGPFESIVLTGGSIRHRVTISLIHSISSGRDFGSYYSYHVYRLVIKDDQYRTRYDLRDFEFPDPARLFKETFSVINSYAEAFGLELKLMESKPLAKREAMLERLSELYGADLVVGK